MWTPERNIVETKGQNVESLLKRMDFENVTKIH